MAIVVRPVTQDLFATMVPVDVQKARSIVLVPVQTPSQTPKTAVSAVRPVLRINFVSTVNAKKTAPKI